MCSCKLALIIVFILLLRAQIQVTQKEMLQAQELVFQRPVVMTRLNFHYLEMKEKDV